MYCHHPGCAGHRVQKTPYPIFLCHNVAVYNTGGNRHVAIGFLVSYFVFDNYTRCADSDHFHAEQRITLQLFRVILSNRHNVTARHIALKLHVYTSESEGIPNSRGGKKRNGVEKLFLAFAVPAFTFAFW